MLCSSVAHKGFTLFISGLAVVVAVSSLVRVIMLYGSVQKPFLNAFIHFFSIFLFFVSILAIGLYHYWRVDRHFYYLPRYYLVLFLVDFIVSLFSISVTASTQLGISVMWGLFALGLLGFGVYSFRRALVLV